MVQKFDLPWSENRKRKLGKESKERVRRPAKRKREAVQAFTVTTPVGTNTRSSPRCN